MHGRTAPIASEAYDPKETLDVQCNRLSGCRRTCIHQFGGDRMQFDQLKRREFITRRT